MRLDRLLENSGVTEVNGRTDIEIENLSFDTRTLDESSIFVCIKGINTDRHKFVEQVISKGCRAIVTEYPVDCGDITNVVVKDTNKALAIIASNFYGNPDKKLKVIGVTGTNGKTTITTLLCTMLENCGYKTGLIGTNDIKIDKKVIPADHTTPEAPQLFEYFSEMVKAGCEYAVMEVSSHSVSLDRIYGIEFELGVFTNLTQDHLDYHITMENYAQAKAKFFSYCKNAVINIDSDYSDIITKGVIGKLITYAVKKDASFKAVDVIHTDSGVKYNVANKEISIDFPIPGTFSVYNSLAVCATSYVLGIDKADISGSLKNASTVKGRCELVSVDKPYKVIIDYAHTPDGMENILTTINEFKKGNIITVFGCGGDRDKGKRPKMGAMGKKYSDILVVTSDNPRSEQPEAIIDDIMAGINDMENVYREADRKEAIKLAMSIAKKDDIVLLLGKGHETVQKFDGYTVEFDERKIVRELCDLV